MVIILASLKSPDADRSLVPAFLSSFSTFIQLWIATSIFHIHRRCCKPKTSNNIEYEIKDPISGSENMNSNSNEQTIDLLHSVENHIDENNVRTTTL